MANLDAATAAKQLLKLGLVTEAQVQECWNELGQKGGELEPLLLVMERKGYLTPWQTMKFCKGDVDGYFLGGYRILYKIASGSFGRVFRADDPHSGRVVAIKVLRRRWSENKHSIELFEREGKVGLTLHHPNLVEILAVSFDRATNQHYIVMEFVEGGNLRDILAIRKKMAPAEALRLLEDAASGLAYAYSRGVTHRDMKLTNILVSSQGTAKVVDFGLAGVYRSMRPEDDSQVDRTVDYAGLEKATGVSPGDVRSDIYFLGCVFYEMLTGRPPLEMSKSKMVRMQRGRFLDVRPIGKDEVQGPPSILRLVETMMSLNPMQRFQTPSQLLDAIREVRREVEGKSVNHRAASAVRSVFVVERDERLQNALRQKFKELGYRVFLAGDPVRALDRFHQQPFDALVMDVGTVGEDGLLLFERLMAEAERQAVPCAGIMVLSEEQGDWAGRVKQRPMVAVMVRPVTLKQLHNKLQGLVPPR
jgi:eukaryotic-like serine/threonine-protein kinase